MNLTKIKKVLEEKKCNMIYSINTYILKQEDIVWINFNPSSGREIQKKKPALVLNSDAYNATTGFISYNKNRPGFIPLSKGHSIYGTINAMQIKGFDFMAKERAVTFIEKATTAELGIVAQIVTDIFSFDKLLGE